MDRLLILGKNKDYRVLSADLEEIMKKILLLQSARTKDDFLNSLATQEKIPASTLKHYGASVNFPYRETSGSRSAPEDLSIFFAQIAEYRKSHGADYALVQQLEIGTGRMSRDISATVQLLNLEE